MDRLQLMGLDTMHAMPCSCKFSTRRLLTNADGQQMSSSGFDDVPDVTSIIDFEFIEFASYLPYEYKISPMIEAENQI